SVRNGASYFVWPLVQLGQSLKYFGRDSYGFGSSGVTPGQTMGVIANKKALLLAATGLFVCVFLVAVATVSNCHQRWVLVIGGE
ncbi:MAG: hypothetical protein L0322_13265, partial [Chloroflexi bacterium]|nr:hypothetical protein [Chloroflexota bacterium]